MVVNALSETYLQAAALHRNLVALAVPPPSKADRIARCFTEWLSIAQFLYWMEKQVCPKVGRVVGESQIFERFRRIDPRSPRKAIVVGKEGTFCLKLASAPHNLLETMEFAGSEWEETKSQLEDYRPVMDFLGLDKQVMLEIKQEIELLIGVDINKSVDFPK